jgi:hypothetical protein
VLDVLAPAALEEHGEVAGAGDAVIIGSRSLCSPAVSGRVAACLSTATSSIALVTLAERNGVVRRRPWIWSSSVMRAKATVPGRVAA